MDKILRVAIICHVSNDKIRKRLELNGVTIKKRFKRFLGYNIYPIDNSVWNTLMLSEFESIKDVEIHAIIPHPDMVQKRQDFVINGVFYHCFRQNMDFISNKTWKRWDSITTLYRTNTKYIVKILDEVQPDLINLIGAEAPFYSNAGLMIDTNKIPFVLTMQTALSDPDFLNYYPIDKSNYIKIRQCEQALFTHSKYIASDCSWYRKIASIYNHDAKFVRYYFCTPSYDVGQSSIKKYDYVYWAANIRKAGWDVIESFVLAYEKDHSLTLNIIGAYEEDYKQRLINRLKDYGAEKNVEFSGFFPSHLDALKEVIKARYALVPIKVDIVSSTIREAFMLGLPVVTYITHGTPELNRERMTVLLSDIGDYHEMASNMLKLASDIHLYETMVKNGYQHYNEYLNNKKGVRCIADMYHAVYNHFYYNEEIPSRLTKTIY